MGINQSSQKNIFPITEEERQELKKDLNLNLENNNQKNIYSIIEEERQENESKIEVHEYSLINDKKENKEIFLSSLFPMELIPKLSEKIHTDYSSKINNQIQKTNKNSSNNYIFNINKEKKIFTGKKRIKELKEGEERHNKYFPDNILRKIQVHSINYIFDLMNELLYIKGYKEKFLKISYNFKNAINKNNVMKLKQSSIGDIIKQNISKKYRTKYVEDIKRNNKLFNQVNNDKFISQILNETYLFIFRNYYLKNKKEIKIDGLDFKLKNIKTLEDLLKKNNDDNRYMKMINEVIEKNYLPKKQFISN